MNSEWTERDENELAYDEAKDYEKSLRTSDEERELRIKHFGYDYED